MLLRLSVLLPERYWAISKYLELRLCRAFGGGGNLRAPLSPDGTHCIIYTQLLYKKHIASLHMPRPTHLPPHLPPHFRLDFDLPQRGAPTTRVFNQATEVVTAHTLADVLPAMEKVARLQKELGCYAVGYVAYEAAAAWDASMRTHPPFEDEPLVYFGLFNDYDPEASPEPVAGAIDSEQPNYRTENWQISSDYPQYAADIAAIRTAIAEGRTYQVNHTLTMHNTLHTPADPAQEQAAINRYYLDMTQRQQAPYCAHLNLSDYQILCASPELFFTLDADTQRIATRPMKGTRPRGLWAAQDQAYKTDLAASAKDRAENVMIVDLLRNDLGRIAETGSVEVTQLFDIEQYPTVWQMTSTVEATLPPAHTWLDAFAALFPCGSVTGAPKVETMGIIHDREPTPRGVYCGSIGVIEPNGSATFNVAIRTVTLHRAEAQRWRARYHTGGGITWGSTAQNEYDEVHNKAAFLPKQSATAENTTTNDHPTDFQLLETLLYSANSDYMLLDEHMRRLAESAAYFNFAFDAKKTKQALSALASELPASGTDNSTYHRVRLLLHRDGQIETSHTTTDAPQPSPYESNENGTTQPPRAVMLSSHPIDSRHRWLYHKTTNRAIYQHAREQLAQTDCFDVLLHNEQGELCEFTIGNLVMELDGALYTPPLSSGLLAGTLRANALAQGCIQERVLNTADLQSAARIWLINSVRGWVQVKLV